MLKMIGLAVVTMTLFAADQIESIGSFPWGSLTATGLLIWLVYYTVKVERPRVEKAHRLERDEMRKERQAESTAFLDELKSERAARLKQTDVFVSELREIGSKINCPPQ